MSNDYQLAVLLQKQFEHEAAVDNPTSDLVYSKKKTKNNNYLNSSKSLTDPSWELIDPTPNIHNLFMAFNEKYFWDKLQAVCIDWSKRMTSCAGICSYQSMGGLCQITLSEPLLKLRPRKDLVETLLHEMIHAYLFVTNNNRDRDGHGPEFHKHMYRINAEAGTNITVYHDFHDEVRLYRQHWWRCNGPCQHLKPYFGILRRATNRAPGPNDRWWGDHERNCGGTFIKVQEPKKPCKKKGGKENRPVASPIGDIRSFYPVIDTNNGTGKLTEANNPSGSTNGATTNRVTTFKDIKGARTKNGVSNSSSTIVINKKPATTIKEDADQVEKPKSNLVKPKAASVSAFPGTGRSLGQPNPKGTSDYSAVRNHWLNKYSSNAPTKRPLSAANIANKTKMIKSDSESINSSKNHNKLEGVVDVVAHDTKEDVNCPICHNKVPASEVNAHLDQCLEEQSTNKPTNCPVCNQEVDVDGLEEHLQECLDNVFSESDGESGEPPELILCLVCNKQIPKDDLNAHLDECMDDNIFNNRGDVCANDDAGTKGDDAENKYNCPVCFEQFPISEMGGHLDVCLSNDDEASNGDGLMNSFLKEEF